MTWSLASIMHGYVEWVNSTCVRVGLTELCTMLDHLDRTPGIAEAMHPAYLEQGRHPRLSASDPPSLDEATDSVRVQSMNCSMR